MQCFQDCCLFCDRDSPDGAYCSQQCKLADHDRAQHSQPTTPSSSYFGGADAQAQYYYYQQQQQQQTTADHTQQQQPLTPSSSRTSLASNMSSSLGSAANGISAQANKDLQGYFNSFDQARAAKRRSSTR